MIRIVEDKIDIDELLQQVEDPGTGAVTLFVGRVRDHAEGKQVLRMDYEAYADMALAKMREIADLTKAKWPVTRIAMVHRTGKLQIGEASVAIAVASAHRHDAFEACRHAIDTLKQIVPIWKREYYSNGQAWVDGVIPQTGKQN